MTGQRALVCRRLKREDLPAITAEWTDLTRRALTPNVFMRPEFVLPGLRRVDRDPSIHALAVFENEQLLGLLLLRQGGLLHARPLPLPVGMVHHFAPLSTPLIAAERPVDIWAAILDRLREDGASALLLPFFEEGPVGAALDEALTRSGLKRAIIVQHQRAALLPEAGGLTSGLSRKSAKNLARLTRRIEEETPLVLTTARTPPEASEALSRYFALEAAGWKGRAGTALAQNAGDQAFFEEMMTELAASGSAMVIELHAGETLAASGLVLRHKDRAYFHKTAYNENLAQFSPGVMLTERLTAILAGEGVIESADAVSSAHHPMIDRLWRGRLTLTHALVPTGASRTGFLMRLWQERGRESAIAVLKTLRDAMRRDARKGVTDRATAGE